MTATATRPGDRRGGDFSEVTRSEAALRTFLYGLPGVDQVGAEARVAMLGTRSIKTTAKAWALDLAIRMVDLTTLEGADTPGKVRALCAKARRPDPADPTCPAVAAICVYPAMVPTAVEAVRDFRDTTGRQVGVKPAGGIRTAKDAIKYLVTVNETVGEDWLHPDWFRFGASTLLNDLLMQRTKMSTGRYPGPDYFTLD